MLSQGKTTMDDKEEEGGSLDMMIQILRKKVVDACELRIHNVYIKHHIQFDIFYTIDIAYSAAIYS